MGRNRKKEVPQIKGLIQEKVTLNKLDYSVVKIGAEVEVKGLGGKISKGTVLQVYGGFFTATTENVSWNVYTADSIAEGVVTVL